MIFVLLTALHVYLPYFYILLTVLLWLFLLVCACIRVFIIKLDYGTRAHSNTRGRVSQAWKGIRKRDNEVWTLCNIQGFQCGCQWMCRWTVTVLLCMHNGFPADRLEQMIMTSLYDIMRVSHAIVQGNYKREHDRASGLLCYCHLGVSTPAFGPLTSYTPSTLAVLVPLE